MNICLMFNWLTVGQNCDNLQLMVKQNGTWGGFLDLQNSEHEEPTISFCFAHLFTNNCYTCLVMTFGSLGMFSHWTGLEREGKASSAWIWLCLTTCIDRQFRKTRHYSCCFLVSDSYTIVFCFPPKDLCIWLQLHCLLDEAVSKNTSLTVCIQLKMKEVYKLPFALWTSLFAVGSVYEDVAELIVQCLGSVIGFWYGILAHAKYHVGLSWMMTWKLQSIKNAVAQMLSIVLLSEAQLAGKRLFCCCDPALWNSPIRPHFFRSFRKGLK